MALVGVEGVGSGDNCPPRKCVKKTFFQDKHWDTYTHRILPRLFSKKKFSKLFINLFTPQPHFTDI